ncbi:MAG: YidB family protein [Gammaproteobacteria bacterium]
MSILSTIVSFASGVVAGPVAEKLVHQAMHMLNDPQTGGLSGLVEGFRQKGLGDLVSSWIGTGENRAVSGEQLQEALGEAKVQQVAQSVGISSQEASSGLAALLPQLIDKLTPDGKLPEGGLVDQALAALKNKLMA